MYFVHSYYLKAEEDIVTARTEYGVSIDASVEKEICSPVSSTRKKVRKLG